ncbi:MAG: undecaprenyl-diphosphate phosphatase [Spirochaetes bacterium]|nr:undecaprenyl-diphosphate phosphatase [Spirochaetota bacterium]
MIPLIIMAIIQGLTEFLPISSSGHLLFIQSLFKIKDINLTIDIFLHLATFLVILIIFFKDITGIVKSLLSSPFDLKKSNTRLFYLILLANIPTAIIGLFLKKYTSFIFEEGFILYITWSITAVLLIISDRIRKPSLSLDKITYIQVLLIGVAQGIAVMPGISRSGITIITALFLGLSRKESARFSFLAGLPAMLGAFLLEFKDMGGLDFQFGELSLVFVIAFLSGLAGILLLFKLLDLKKFKYFGFYLILLLIIKAIFNI